MTEHETGAELPVVVIGAGPVGLAAAAHLLARGIEPLVLEAGDQAGAAVREWNHVRLFSQWSELVDRAAAALLAPTGWTPPAPDRIPHRAGVGRAVPAAARRRPRATASATAPRSPASPAAAGTCSSATAGTASPSSCTSGPPTAARTDSPPAQSSTPAAPGRDRTRSVATACPPSASTTRAVAPHVTYRVPNLDDAAVRARYAERHIAVAGSGHSALTALVALADLARQHPGTRITWLVRRGTDAAVQAAFGGGSADQLPARGALGMRARDSRRLRHRRGPAWLPHLGRRAHRDRLPAAHRRERAGPRRRRRGRRPDRLPTRPDLAVRGPPRPGPGPAGTAQARTPDRPQRPLLRVGPPARRRRTRHPRARPVRRRDEELRTSPDVPRADGLRAGPLRGGRAGRRPRRRRPGRARPARDRRLRRQRPLRRRQRHRRRLLHPRDQHPRVAVLAGTIGLRPGSDTATPGTC